MDSASAFFKEHSDCFAWFGAVAAAYVVFKFLRSIWSGIKVYILGRALGLGTDLRKLGAWAVVTGSTDGIGKGYAKELARKGLNIVLISRSPEKLTDVAQEIEQKYNVKTKTIAVDFLAGPEIYEKIKSEIAGMDIGTLVNNVGMSHTYPMYYGEATKEDINNIVNINTNSVTNMTRIILPSMVEKKKGAIINISSGSGAYPTSLLTAYSASKVFVDFFSRALQTEYRSKGIIVQVVMPFFVATKLSKIRRASVIVPNPTTFARSAVATIGMQERTYGCIAHAIQGWIITALPEWFLQMANLKFMGGVRKAAIRRLEKKK